MTDLYRISKGDIAIVRKILERYYQDCKWIKLYEVKTVWEENELFINNRNAYGYSHGKHKGDLQRIVNELFDSGIRVTLVSLRGIDRIETEVKKVD